MVFKMKRLIFLLFFPLLIFAEKNFEPWGKDSDLKYVKEKPSLQKKPTLAAKAANKVILFHQNYLSPTTGPRSNFRPTSSKYMQLAIERYGFLKGYLMGCDRLIRENKEIWVYKKIVINDVEYKYDPALDKKYISYND